MKLKVINFDSKNVFGSIKQAVFTSALSYAKMYELLHKQIWRKAPYRIKIATLPVLSTFKGRPVGFVRKWDIKSPSKLPYSYDGRVIMKIYSLEQSDLCLMRGLLFYLVL